ncbi:MAG: hypothetical protein MUC90_01400, partial [Thermoplasmata archaeon]|nr:hypothetical protein [Thermoplasmata archaeon]
MLGKADKLVANRSLSALVFVCLILSAFAGILVMSDSTPTRAQAIGDLNIVGTRYTIENLYQPVDGNVTVGAGGELYIKDATLSIISNDAPGLQHVITVSAGGKLTLDHATITTYLDQITSWPFLTLTIDGTGTTMTATNNSVLMFPGDFVVSNSATVKIHDTTITALPSSSVIEFYSGGDPFKLDAADDGPWMTVASASLSMYDSTVDSLPEFPALDAMGGNLTLTGSAWLLAVNSYIGVDFGPLTVLDDWYIHNTLDLQDLSHAYLYGTEFEAYAGSPAERAPAITTSSSGSFTATPATKGAADNTGEVISDLASVDGATYQVTQAETMEIETWTLAGLSDSLPVSSVSLLATYTVSPTYAGTAALQYAREGTAYADTTIVPKVTDPVGTTLEYDVPVAAIPTVGAVKNMDARFVNNGAV